MKKLLGGILMAVGLLVALASGICTLVVLVSGLNAPAEWTAMIPAVLIVGGIPFAIGTALFLTGRALVRQTDGDAPNGDADHS